MAFVSDPWSVVIGQWLSLRRCSAIFDLPSSDNRISDQQLQGKPGGVPPIERAASIEPSFPSVSSRFYPRIKSFHDGLIEPRMTRNPFFGWSILVEISLIEEKG